jgi:twitching motility protein PilT
VVLASLHSRSAAAAVARIVDGCRGRAEGEVRAQLAEALRAIVAQRLLPRAGGGRVVAVEVLRMTHSVACLVREGRLAQIATAMQSGRREGLLALESCLADLVRSGTVRREAAEAVANDPEAFNSYVNG